MKKFFSFDNLNHYLDPNSPHFLIKINIIPISFFFFFYSFFIKISKYILTIFTLNVSKMESILYLNFDAVKLEDEGYFDAEHEIKMKRLRNLTKIDGFYDKENNIVSSQFYYTIYIFLLTDETYDCFKLLIDNCKDINEKEVGGWTLLHHACIFGNIDIVILLIQKGANIYSLTDTGKTPFDVACQYNNPELVEYLGKLMLGNN